MSGETECSRHISPWNVTVYLNESRGLTRAIQPARVDCFWVIRCQSSATLDGRGCPQARRSRVVQPEGSCPHWDGGGRPFPSAGPCSGAYSVGDQALGTNSAGTADRSGVQDTIDMHPEDA